MADELAGAAPHDVSPILNTDPAILNHTSPDWTKSVTLGTDSSGPVTLNGLHPSATTALQNLVGIYGPVHLNSTTGGVHAQGSEHYAGRAIDVDINGKSPADLVNLIESGRKAGFTGIGIGATHLHLDTRPSADGSATVFPDAYNGPVAGLDKDQWQARLNAISPTSLGAPVAAPGTAPTSSVSLANSTPNDPVNDAQRADQANAAAHRYANSQGFVGSTVDTLANNTLTSNMLRTSGVPEYDPNYNVTPQQVMADERLKGIPEPYTESLLDSHSQSDYDARVQNLLRIQDYAQRNADSGFAGTAGSVVGQILDPSAWVLGGLIGKLGLSAGELALASSGLARTSILGKGLLGGFEGAAAGGGLELANRPFDPTWTQDRLLYGTALGGAIGFGLGQLRKPHRLIKTETEDLQGAHQDLQKSLDARYADGYDPSTPITSSVRPPDWTGRFKDLADAVKDMFTGGASSGEREAGSGSPLQAFGAESPLTHPELANSIQAYHGTVFNFLQAALRLGTGEGTNAYGPGFYAAEAPGIANYYKNFVANKLGQAGSFYKMLITAPRDNFIDWDKGLADQTPLVKAALEKHGYADDADLARAKADLQSNQTGPGIAAKLSQEGVAGTKYLDRPSREGRRQGIPKSNYVVFDPEKHILITHRNGEHVLDLAMKEHGIDPDTVPPLVRTRAIDIMAREGVTDPVSALDRALQITEEDVGTRAKQDTLHGQDTSRPSEGSGSGPVESGRVGEVAASRSKGTSSPETKAGGTEVATRPTPVERPVFNTMVSKRAREIDPANFDKVAKIDNAEPVLKGHLEDLKAALKKGDPEGTIAEALAKVQGQLAKNEADRAKAAPKVDEAFDKAHAEHDAAGIHPYDADVPAAEAPHYAPRSNPAPADVGAAANPGMVQLRNDGVEKWLTPRAATAFDRAKVAFNGVPVLGRIARFTTSARLRSTENVPGNAWGTYLMADRIGNADHSATPLDTASEGARMEHNAAMAKVSAQFQAAFDAFAKRQEWNWLKKRQNMDRFNGMVADAITERDPAKLAQMAPEARQAADAMRKTFNDYHDKMLNPGADRGATMRPLDGAEDVTKDPNYFPHIWNFAKLAEYAHRFGDTAMIKAFRDAIEARYPDFSPGQLDMLAKGLYNGTRDVSAGQEIHVSKSLSGEDKAGLAAMLGRHTSASREEIDAVMQRLIKPEEKDGSIARLKSRTNYDEAHEMTLTDHKTGEQVPFKMKDLLDWNASNVMTAYSRQMEGQLAMARLRIPNPNYEESLHGPGGVLEGDQKPNIVDGVYNDAEWAKAMKEITGYAEAQKLDMEDAKNQVRDLTFVKDRVLGRPQDSDQGKLAAALRTARTYNVARMLGQVGFQHIPQAWQALSQIGVKAAWASMPSFGTFVRDAVTGQLSDKLAAWIEESTGIGSEYMRHASHSLSLDDFGSAIRNSPWETLDKGAGDLARYTTVVGGLTPIMTTLQRWSAAGAVVRFAQDAAGNMELNWKRMRALGLDPETQKSIADCMRKYGGIQEGQNVTKASVTQLNLDKWPAYERHAFLQAITRWTAKMVQENDIGQMNLMFDTTIGKMLTQFRTFSMGGLANNTLHGLHMADSEAVSGFLGSSALGALSYVAQTHLKTLGMSEADRQKFVNDRLTLTKVAAAAIHRGNYFSLAPGLLDTGLVAAGMDPMFDQARSSGLASTGFGSNPTFDLADSVVKAVRGVAGATVRGEPYSRMDLKALIGTLPMGNTLPVQWAANGLMQNMPKASPHNFFGNKQ